MRKCKVINREEFLELNLDQLHFWNFRIHRRLLSIRF